MKSLTALFMLVSLAILLLSATACRAASLPQRHPYQVTLRNYMATLTEADFTLELKPVTYVEDYFTDLDTVGRYWMLFLSQRDTDIPDPQGIRVSPKHFTLAAIEEGDTVKVGQGRGGGFMDPKDVAWWTQWDYPGNPYLGSKPLKLRAFVMAAADMMMQDEEHQTGRNLRSDYLGGSMIRYAYTYRATRDAVPQPAREAYAAGLIRMFEKLEKLTPRGSGGSDMEFFQLSAMWYAADALGGDYMPRALARAHVVIDKITSKTGYEKHGNAFDVSYQGIALRFLTWGAMLYNDPKVNEALHKMLVLKAYLTLPEPNGRLFGPTHFNTGTAGDAPGDQWAWISRDYAMSMVDDLALYTIWARSRVLNEADMRSAVKTGIEKLNTTTPSDATPTVWKEVHWVQTLNFAFDHYRPGFYQRLVKLAEENAPATKTVYARGEQFINDLNGGGEFLAAKFDNYGVVLHTGAIAQQWARGVSGKSGGGISAFWTPDTGTAILGRARATQSQTPDEWTDENNRGPYTWAVHAITGCSDNGLYFSTARIRDITSKYEIDGTKRAVVTITGDLAGSATGDPRDELKSVVLYERTFRIDKDGVAVTSGLRTDGDDPMPELWEMIPIHTGPTQANTKIDFKVKGEWVAATTTLAEVEQIRLTRYDKSVAIVLEKPCRVKLNNIVENALHPGTTVRNVMIDLTGLGNNPSVSYRIIPTP